MLTPINILIVEDSAGDTLLLIHELKSAGFDPKWEQVETESAFLKALTSLPDIILCDYSMPEFNGLRAAILLRESGLNIPFILISGTMGEDVAVEAMKNGCTDYLIKDRLGRLGNAVRRALQETEARVARLRLETELAHVGRVSLMGHLSAALAHEINQPLGAILRNAEAAELYLQNASPDLEEIRAILADIRKDDQRAGAVIERMRALMKRDQLATCPLDVSDLLADVSSLTRGEAADRKVSLELDVQHGLPTVQGDRVHLQQVLLNLILNGLDALVATPPGNRLLTLSAQLANMQTIEFAVIDRGPGIPAGNFEHLFDSFFTTKTNGMGMGLPISRTIIEAHGGKLWAENNAGSGAAFRFTVPVAGDTK